MYGRTGAGRRGTPKGALGKGPRVGRWCFTPERAFSNYKSTFVFKKVLGEAFQPPTVSYVTDNGPQMVYFWGIQCPLGECWGGTRQEV